MRSIPINHQLAICEPFCDYLNVTSFKDNASLVLDEIRPFLDVVGASETLDGLFTLPDKGGTFKTGTRNKVCVFSASGGFLEAFRSHGVFADYLCALFQFPHRVSMLHATADFRIDAPPVIEAIYELGKAGKLSFTRKAITSNNVNKLVSPARDGRDTGTVYLGNRKNADVWGKVYDKGHERFCKTGADFGQLVRVEIAVQSDIGATLKDAYNPHNLFYHFAGQSVVTQPANFAPWLPFGDGFDLERTANNLTGIQRLKGILDNSLDVSRLLRISRNEYGADASQVLCSLINKRFDLRAL